MDDVDSSVADPYHLIRIRIMDRKIFCYGSVSRPNFDPDPDKKESSTSKNSKISLKKLRIRNTGIQYVENQNMQYSGLSLTWPVKIQNKKTVCRGFSVGPVLSLGPYDIFELLAVQFICRCWENVLFIF